MLSLKHHSASRQHNTIHVKDTDYFREEIVESDKLFAYSRFNHEIHSPVLTNITFGDYYYEVPRCLDMPIRLAGETKYKLPIEYSSIKQLIEKVLRIEHAHNKNWQDYNTYITIDNSVMNKDQQQRRGGLHVDGFQGERITKKTKLTRSYIGTTNGGTIYYPQKFIVADPQKFNVFEGFELQLETKPHVMEEQKIYFMDALTVHESGFARVNGNRTFFRVTFDLREFDRLGNTINPNLYYNWEMVDRDIQLKVIKPNMEDILNSPYQ